MIHEMMLLHPFICYTFAALLTLAVGSFLNVVIYRLPISLQAEWRNQCRIMLNLAPETSAPLNLSFPRSFCPHCKKTIPAYHNIPLLSFLWLKGRCHHCQHPIDYHYPMIEATCLGLSLFALWIFGLTMTLLFAWCFIWITLCLTMIDLKHQLLPDSLTLGLLWLGLFANVTTQWTSLPEAVFSAAGAYITLWLVIKLFYAVTGKMGMGHGDLKLFAALGAWFGWTELPMILLISSISGTLVGATYLKMTRQAKDTPIPFGPFLCVAGLIVLFI